QGGAQVPGPIGPPVSAGHQARGVGGIREALARRWLAALGRQSRCRGQVAQTKACALSPGPQSAPATEGACHAPPPATWPGAGLGEAQETDRRGSPEEPG